MQTTAYGHAAYCPFFSLLALAKAVFPGMELQLKLD